MAAKPFGGFHDRGFDDADWQVFEARHPQKITPPNPNTMSAPFKPVADYILIQWTDAPPVAEGGIIAPYTDNRAPRYAKVIAAGPHVTNSLAPMCYVGDTVLIHAGCGVDARVGSESYTFVNTGNLLAVVKAA